MTGATVVVDTHCHLDFPDFDRDRDAILDSCRRLGVLRIVVPAVARDNWDPVLALCATSPMLVPAIGLHPVFMKRHRDQDLLDLDRRLHAVRPCAVGEIGLDYFLRDLDRERQREICSCQLEIASRHRLPVILHVRKAHDDMLLLIRDTGFDVGGLVHAFNGSVQQAGKYIESGFCLGFGGMLTYPRSRRIRDLATRLPLDSIVLETDAPDMAPEAHQGRRNSPEYVVECLQGLAALRRLPVAELARVTTANATRVLALDLP